MTEADREVVERLKAKRQARLAAKAAEAAKRPVLTMPVTAGMAEVINNNPESVVVHARGRDGVPRAERPATLPQPANGVRVRTDMVGEVDAQGRPVWDRPGTVSDYDPFSRERMWGRDY